MSLIALILLATMPLLPATPAGTQWYPHGYNKALRDAGHTGQLVMIALLPEWSEYSNRVADETFTDPRVAEGVADLIPVKFERDDAHLRQVAKLYNIENFPAIVFVDHRGRVEDLIEGFIPADPMLEQLARITQGIGTVSAHQAAVDSDGEDMQARWELLDMLRNVRDWRRAETVEHSIRHDDPDSQTLAGSRLERQELWNHVWASLESEDDEPDYSTLLAHYQTRSDANVRLDGWFELGNVCAGREDMSGARSAFMTAWNDVSEDRVANVGTSLVKFFMGEDQGKLNREEQAWALATAQAAVSSAHSICEAQGTGSKTDGDAYANDDEGDESKMSEDDQKYFLAERLSLLAKAQSRFAPKRQRKQLAVASAKQCVELLPEEEGFQELLDEMLALR